jgi:hypothetical protein
VLRRADVPEPPRHPRGHDSHAGGRDNDAGRYPHDARHEHHDSVHHGRDHHPGRDDHDAIDNDHDACVDGRPDEPTGGGGQVGLLLISQYVKPNSADLVDYYNHFSLLASIENLFGLKRLGYASDLTLPVFDQSTFNGSAP